LHPETPVEGVLLERLFPGLDAGKMLESLRRAGEPYGVRKLKATAEEFRK